MYSLKHLFCVSPSRNKYTSKSTSSWKLFAQKPEPQEVPFSSGSCAAQVGLELISTSLGFFLTFVSSSKVVCCLLEKQEVLL